MQVARPLEITHFQWLTEKPVHVPTRWLASYSWAMTACGSCDTVLRDNARFCDECGAAIALSGVTVKYKQVTVLFAEVVRSMDFAAAVDIERLREIMTEVVERSAAAARRYGGIVEYNGDGVMALFGAPGRERARRDGRDAIPLMREAVDVLRGKAQVFGTGDGRGRG